MANKTRVQVRGTIGKSVRIPPAAAAVAAGLQPVKGLAGNYQNASIQLDANGQIVKIFNGTGGGGGGGGTVTSVELTSTDGSVTLTGTNPITSSGTIDLSVSGGGATPLPATIPDLVWWFDASITNITANNIVSRLRDSGPFLNSAAETGATLSATVRDATLLNSLPVLTWPGNSGGRFTLNSGLPLQSGGSFFAVVNPTAMPAFNMSGPNASLRYTTGDSNGKPTLVVSLVVIIAEATTPLTPGAWQQCNATYNTTTHNYSFRLGSAADGSGTAGGGAAAPITGTTDSFGYSAVSGGEDASGSVAEFIVYNRELTLTEVQSVEAYLTAKWGV